MPGFVFWVQSVVVGTAWACGMNIAPDAKSALRRAKFALIWERKARVVWPAVFFPCAFVILALIGVWESVGDPWRLLALIGSLLGLVLCMIVGVVAGRWPRARDVRRRVEQDSALAHRPLETLADRPQTEDPRTLALWRAHQKRVREGLKALRAARPRPAYQRLDPYALRFVLLALLAVSAFVGRDAWSSRLGEAFTLAYVSNAPDTSVVDAWITPPDYTGEAPIFLSQSTQVGAPVTAPAGSEVTVRVTGAPRRPRGGVAGEGVDLRLAFAKDGPGAYVAVATLDGDATVHLRQPKDRAWVALIEPDLPPSVAFTDDEFGQSPRQELTLSYTVGDDYGGVRTQLRLRRVDTGEEEVLDLPAPNAQLVENTARVDLVKHKWAGLEVEASVLAIDAIGQQGESEVRTTTLPERLFLEPLALAIANERFVLLRDDSDYEDGAFIPGGGASQGPGQPMIDLGGTRLERAPASVKRVYAALDLLQMGAGLFVEDDQYPTMLALAYAKETMARAERRADLAELDELLWQAAMSAEGGELASARRAFEAARQALADALARGADAEELEQRVQAFKNAAERYMDMLYAEAILNENFADPGAGGGGPGQSVDELAQMLESLEDLSTTGSTDDARRLLEQLGDRIANMEMQLNTQRGSGGSSSGRPPPPIEGLEEEEQTQQALGELSDVIGEQRELADATQQDALNNGRDARNSRGQTGEERSNPEDGDPDGAQNGSEDGGGPERGDIASQQQALADRLAGLREQLEERGEGSLAEGLSEAEQAMRDAARSLRLGDEAGAAMDQSAALGALRGAAENYAAEKLAERLADIGSMSEEEIARLAEQMGRDPEDLAANLDTIDPSGIDLTDPFGRDDFGRPFDGVAGAQIPDELDIERAREILDELRRRAGEVERDEEELEYIQRLLELF